MYVVSKSGMEVILALLPSLLDYLDMGINIKGDSSGIDDLGNL
jgi:hypothetical protein